MDYISLRIANEYTYENDICILNIKGNKAIIDIEDYDKIKKYNWCYSSNKIYSKQSGIYHTLSKVILGITDNVNIFYIDGDVFNNRKSNLSIGHKGNIIYEENEIGIMVVDGKKYKFDIEDKDLISQYTWKIDRDGYLRASSRRDKLNNNKQKLLLFHRLVLNAPDGMLVDHIDRDRTNNQKSNLRLCNAIENTWNRSKCFYRDYKGVYYSKKLDKWLCRLRINRKDVFCKVFDNEIAAANAYNYYAKQEQGEFAVLNDVPFMPEDEWKKHMSKYASEYHGLAKLKNDNWDVAIYIKENNKQKRIWIGRYSNEIAAANAYNYYLKKYMPESNKPFNNVSYMSKQEIEKYALSKNNYLKENGGL